MFIEPAKISLRPPSRRAIFIDVCDVRFALRQEGNVYRPAGYWCALRQEGHVLI